jgi:hypothetical protein
MMLYCNVVGSANELLGSVVEMTDHALPQYSVLLISGMPS